MYYNIYNFNMQSLIKIGRTIGTQVPHIKTFHQSHKHIPSSYHYVTTSDINKTNILSSHIANIIKGLNTHDKNNIVQIKEIASDTYEMTFFANYSEINKNKNAVSSNSYSTIKYKGHITFTQTKTKEPVIVSDLNKDEEAYLNVMSNKFALTN